MSGRRRGTQALILGAAVWVLAGVALFLVARGLDGHQRQLFDKLKTSEMTAGTFVSKDTANHDSFEYRYIDRLGHQHTGGDGGEGQEQGDPADLAVGARITVWYNPRQPDISCYCTPSKNTGGGLDAQEIVISQFVAVGLGAAAGLTRWRKGSRPPGQGQRNVVGRRV